MAYTYNDNSITDELIKKMIPVLVRWAQGSWDKIHLYSDLQKAIGHTTPRLGHQLGCLNEVLNGLEVKFGHIPTLNALVCNKGDLLPSEGFGYVDDTYNSLSYEAKRAYVEAKNKEAHEYDWQSILKELGLKPSTIIESEELSKVREGISHYGKGGEGEAHKALKERIKADPIPLGIDGVVIAETEHTLLSGDRVDVYFETDSEIFAIEVKSHISNEDDIIRGIFQCIKYQAVLEKEQIFAEKGKVVNTTLVLEGALSDRCREIVADLDIDVVENY